MIYIFKMPIRKSKPKAKHHAKPRRTAARYPARQVLTVRDGLPVPPRLVSKLSYVQSVTLAAGTGLATAQIVLNGAYNPFPAGGHQPMGFDQMMSFYQFYRVLGAKVTCIFSNGVNSDNPPMVGISFTENASFSPTSLAMIIERGNVVYRQHCTFTSGVSTTLSKRWSAKKWYGPAYNDVQQGGTASANPAGELAYANIWSSPTVAYGGATFDAVICNIKVEYIVEFSGQLQLTQS
nr:MAG: capsid protein [Cressdnaviricota sp.]